MGKSIHQVISCYKQSFQNVLICMSMSCITAFSTLNTWSSCTGWYFRADKCPFKNSNQKKKKGLKALLFRAWKELQGWQHSAWQCDMVAQREHRAMISLSLRVISGVIFFPLPVCWMLHLYTACLLLSWQKFGMPIFLPQASMLIMLEGLCDRSNVALQEKGHNAKGVQLYFYLQSCRVEKPGLSKCSLTTWSEIHLNLNL